MVICMQGASENVQPEREAEPVWACRACQEVEKLYLRHEIVLITSATVLSPDPHSQLAPAFYTMGMYNL